MTRNTAPRNARSIPTSFPASARKTLGARLRFAASGRDSQELRSWA